MYFPVFSFSFRPDFVYSQRVVQINSFDIHSLPRIYLNEILHRRHSPLLAFLSFSRFVFGTKRRKLCEIMLDGYVYL